MPEAGASAAGSAVATGAGASGALNMWYDADIDRVMSRTANRPVPSGRVLPGEAVAQHRHLVARERVDGLLVTAGPGVQQRSHVVLAGLGIGGRRRLRLLLPVRVKRMTHADFELSDSVKSEFVEIELSKESAAVGKPIVDLRFPKAALISLIRRGGKFISPNGTTVLEAGDVLWVIAETKASMKEAYTALEIKYLED